MTIEVVSLAEKFSKFTERWSPKIVADINDSHVKLAKLAGEFEWHRHEQEDELFLVIRGTLHIRVRENGEQRDLVICPGEFVVIPRNVDHLPWADEECEVMILEPKSTLNTGNVRNQRTKEVLDRI